MAPTYFKFTTAEGVNRRLTFSERPTWPLLASKLQGLYGISVDNVGVSYIDSDNDEITVSSDEELQDFYKHQVGQTIKFAVVDLHASQNNAAKPFELPSFNRNPFDGDAFEFIGEWEKFPSVLVDDRSSKSGPHAFVEVLSSNNSVARDHTHQADTDTDDDHSTAQPPLSNKGKGRSLSFGAASIASVLGEEISQKHPIHVYDLNSRKDDKGKDKSFDDPSAHIHVPAQSTPKVQAKNIDDNKDTEETTPLPKALEVEDPPLPSLDESPPSATSASLIQDLASLVHDATQVVSSHPELSEGLRNIGRNITAGTYWTTHREALSNTVNGMTNPPSTEGRRQVDEDAVMRLTSVAANFFRTLSQLPVGTEDTRIPDINENRSDQSHGENFAHISPPWWGFQGMRSLGPHPPGSRPHIPPIPFGMHPSHAPHDMPHGPSRQPSFPFHHAPHPVSLPPFAPAITPPAHHPSPSTHDYPSSALPPLQTADPSVSPLVQGHIPPPPPLVPPPNGNPTPMPGMCSPEIQSHGPSVNNPPQSYQGYVPFSPVTGDQPRSQGSKPNAQDLRAQVEAAKRIYKAEKERYRQEREQRRREKLADKPTMRISATYVQGFPKYLCAHQAYRVGSAPVAQAGTPKKNETSSIQLQGMYSEAEKVSIPRRSHTHLGHGPFRHQEGLTTRAIARITKKLADVGYGLSKSSMF